MKIFCKFSIIVLMFLFFAGNLSSIFAESKTQSVKHGKETFRHTGFFAEAEVMKQIEELGVK